MLEHISIQGFKRFSFAKFELRPLTILAGRNGAGKTSVIHAIILMIEALKRRSGIPLSGMYGLDLGDFQDVLNVGAEELFRIKARRGGQEVAFEYAQADTPRYSEVTIFGLEDNFADYGLPRFFQYLAAERYGPRLVQQSASSPAEEIEVGHFGQFSAHLLEERGGREVVADARRSSSADPSLILLKDQTEAWLSRITTPLQIDTEKFFGTGMIALKYRGDDAWVRPTNMGFGITFALPIVLAGLTVKEQGLLLVENPEAHLHPAGQAQLGLFLAQVAESGVQVVVETHSDHVINGIRRAIGEEKRLKAEAALVHYFENSSDDPVALEFTPDGGMSDWPPGFFDQYQIDIAALTKARFSKK